MFQRILGKRARADRPGRAAVTTYHVEQGFVYEEFSENDFTAKIILDSPTRITNFAVANGRNGSFTVAKQVPGRATSFIVRKTQSTYTLTPSFSATTKYIITNSIFGYNATKLSDGTLPDNACLTANLETFDAFDAGIFLSELSAEEDWDALPPRTGPLFTPLPSTFPPEIEASIAARRLVNAPIDTF
ncbi:hypothetical protein BDZ45DRAFT_752887 [Acephala macrosclerotiorum]|nr:hypothetical protein BDZ45DRAFT_752887 [Acephala macrosclerotiorum]